MKMEPLAKAAQTPIEGARFQLRAPRASDFGLLEMHRSDQRVARATRTIPHPLPPGATEAFIANSLIDPTKEVWLIDGTKAGLPEVQGQILLDRLDRDQSEVSFWIVHAFWNSHLATDALAALIATRPQNARTLFATMFQDNPASARVLTNCGFTYLGDAEAHSVARGAVVPTWTYTLKLE